MSVATSEVDRSSREPGSRAELPLSMAGAHNPWLVAFVVSIATFMEVLDTSIANVARCAISPAAWPRRSTNRPGC